MIGVEFSMDDCSLISRNCGWERLKSRDVRIDPNQIKLMVKTKTKTKKLFIYKTEKNK
jgi:hypothetical protein